MPSESLIARMEKILEELTTLGGENERTSIITNLTVVDPAPSGLTDFIVVEDHRDGDYITAKTVPGVVYNTNDTVNVIFIEGTEPLAFQHGSTSSGTNVPVDAQYVTLATNATLTNERVLTAGNGLTSTDGGAGSTITLDTGAGAGITVNANDVALTTPGTLTAATSNSSTGNHTHAITTTSDGAGTVSTILSGDASGDISLRRLTLDDRWIHDGDADTYGEFTDDQIDFVAGGLTMLRLDETTQDVVYLGDVGGAGDVDININNNQVFINGDTGQVGINETVPQRILHVTQGGGTVPALSTGDGILVQNNASAGANARIAILGGASGDSVIDFSNSTQDGDGQIIYDNANNEFQFTTNAIAQQMVISSAGDVGIGSTGPDAKLDVLDTSGAQLRLTHTDGSKFVDFTLDTNHDLTVTPSSTGQVIFQPTTDSTDFFQVLDADGGTPVLNVNSTDENVGIATTTNDFAFQGGTGTGILWVERVDAAGLRGVVFNTTSDTASRNAQNVFLRARVGPAAVADVDRIGDFFWSGHDGTDYNRSARFGAIVDGTVSPNTVPMAIVFDTSETNSGGIAERMRIEPGGNVGIGAISSSAQLHVDQASTTAAKPVLYLDQADISEEMIEFNTTIGTGNAIEAVGTKSLSTTHFIKVTLPGALTRYIAVGTIA